MVDADLNLRCRMSALQKQDLGRLKLKGKLDMKQMVLKDTTHNFSFTGDASLAFIGNEVLGAKMEINKIALTSNQINSINCPHVSSRPIRRIQPALSTWSVNWSWNS